MHLDLYYSVHPSYKLVRCCGRNQITFFAKFHWRLWNRKWSDLAPSALGSPGRERSVFHSTLSVVVTHADTCTRTRPTCMRTHPTFCAYAQQACETRIRRGRYASYPPNVAHANTPECIFFGLTSHNIDMGYGRTIYLRGIGCINISSITTFQQRIL